MNMRATLDPFNGYCPPGPHTPLINKMVGTAYGVVRIVAVNVPYIRHVAHHMEDVFKLNKIAEAVNAVAGIAPEVTAVADASANIQLLSGVVLQMQVIGENIQRITEIYEELPTLALFSLNEKTKLNGVAFGATANSADNFLLSRANHTGNQEATTVLIEDDVDAALVGGNLQAAFVALVQRTNALETQVAQLTQRVTALETP